MEIITKDPKATQEAGRKLGFGVKPPHCFLLKGDLGSGKTTFAKGLAEGLGIKSRITSPTFIIMREYPISSKSNFYHIDLYRIQDNLEDNLHELGIFDLINQQRHILAVEWPGNIGEFLKKNFTEIVFNTGKHGKRITINKK